MIHVTWTPEEIEAMINEPPWLDFWDSHPQHKPLHVLQEIDAETDFNVLSQVWLQIDGYLGMPSASFCAVFCGC